METKRTARKRRHTAIFKVFIVFKTGPKAGEKSYFPAGWKAHTENAAAKQRAAYNAKNWIQQLLDTTNDLYWPGIIYDYSDGRKVGTFDDNGNITWL